MFMVILEAVGATYWHENAVVNF